MPKSIYIHIPFCKTHCPYCDFAVYLDHKGQQYEAYVDALCREIQERSKGELIETIYLGGGTPSILPIDSLKRIFVQLQDSFDIDQNAEITLEANPGTLNEHKLSELKELGVNRLSIGVQTFSESLNKKLARGHSVQDALEILDLAKKVGFGNLSLDLIYGLPKQTLANWLETIEIAFEQNIQHISCYSLAIEEGTPFQKIYGSSEHPDLPNEDLLFEMYEELQRMCLKRGFVQYEVSNFAIPGFEAKHNLTYWRNQEFYGFGVSAHEFIAGKRKAHTRDLRDYLQNPCNQQTLDCNPPLEELMLKLRLREGLDLEDYKSRYEINLIKDKRDLLQDFESRGLVSINKDRLHLTYKGFLLSTQIISSLI